MNPLTNVKNLQKLNEKELELGLAGSKTSWHNQYKDSAWVFVGGLPYDLTEGDVICAFSQYGEIVNMNYVRDKSTGKPKGFCFLCYEDQRSTILAVDNLNGIKLLGRTLKVDHVANYKPPKVDDDVDELTKALREKGCAPRASSDEELDSVALNKVKKEKKKKKKKEKHKKVKHEKKRKKKHEPSSSSDDSESPAEMGDVRNDTPETQTVKHGHYRTDKEEHAECNDNAHEESSRKLERDTHRKRRRDQSDHSVSKRQEDHGMHSNIKQENHEEYSERNESRHRERTGNCERSRDTRIYDDGPDRQRERSRRDIGGDRYTDGRDRNNKYMTGHTDSDEDRRFYSNSHQREDRYRDDRGRRPDSNDRQHKRRH